MCVYVYVCVWGAGSRDSFPSFGEEVGAVPFQNWSLFVLHADFWGFFIILICNSLSSKGISRLVAHEFEG